MKLFGMTVGRSKADSGLDSPRAKTRRGGPRIGEFRMGGKNNSEVFGRWTETVARGMGTPWFLLILTLFAAAWLVFNTVAPEGWRFDSAALGFTALTLILSLQASYAAPMILLAQNRQDDRDRVQIEQDRQRAERNLADTEFLAREVVALRLAIKDLPDRDFLRTELRLELREFMADLGSSEANISTADLEPSETNMSTAGLGSSEANLGTAAPSDDTSADPRLESSAEATSTAATEDVDNKNPDNKNPDNKRPR